MKLIADKHPETIKRYAHIPPARVWAKTCDLACPGTSYACSRDVGHRGPHVAHGVLRRVVAVWDADAPPARKPPPAVAKADRAVAHRISKEPKQRPEAAGLVQFLKTALQRGPSVEEVAFLILFLAFVGFAIDWFLKILG